MSPDERPVPPTTLDAFYDLVPQAEEIDLRDELDREEQRRRWLDLLSPLLSPADPAAGLDEATDGAADEPLVGGSDPEDEPWQLSDGQVLGMLEHLLGAEQLDGRNHLD